MREYCAQFERDLENDNYTPITAQDEKEFKAVVSQFPFYRRGMDQVMLADLCCNTSIHAFACLVSSVYDLAFVVFF